MFDSALFVSKPPEDSVSIPEFLHIHHAADAARAQHALFNNSR